MIDDNEFVLLCAIIGVVAIALARAYQTWHEKKRKERNVKQGYIGPGDW